MNWLDTYIKAYMWWCGDEICDCHQPKIELIYPNKEAGKPWIKINAIWEGTFTSEGCDKIQFEELRKAAVIYRIDLDADNYGIRLIDDKDGKFCPTCGSNIEGQDNHLCSEKHNDGWKQVKPIYPAPFTR